ncbi:CPXCG motif-containing cysteine-rich protein [Rubellicoccus peritrichatus]|uniref:CPXCG motif-containing cysteine-rich protein n=1 Tax=Rubellicoccus peritrichatus TaxID=3080537 RepID=A0AAQ3L7C5_9BACT|nr:CPXCG motif-containing cysteine-rich protein [Puniceicoccus sp. CR14]WOO39987.1 CPXCG motif-containing cysteine-rich protein [Puniceicoccus sp. CR14]
MQAESSCAVTCPFCFQEFSVYAPAPDECPTEWDYDCEVCCRPMLLRFTVDEEAIDAEVKEL